MNSAGGDFYSRRDALVVCGSAAELAAVDVDAIRRFANVVLPLLIHSTPAARLIVRGSVPPELTAELASPHIAFAEPAQDRAEMFDSARCVLVLAAGQEASTAAIEALLRGVPVVAPSFVAAALSPAVGAALLRDDPGDVAAATASLLTNPRRWQAARVQALDFRATHNGAETMPSEEAVRLPASHDRDLSCRLDDMGEALRGRVAELFTLDGRRRDLQASADDHEREIARLRAAVMTEHGEVLATKRDREVCAAKVARLEDSQRALVAENTALQRDADRVRRLRAVAHRTPMYLSVVRPAMRWLLPRVVKRSPLSAAGRRR